MKKRFLTTLVALLLLAPLCAHALGLGPEAAVTALNNLSNRSPIEGLTQKFIYDEDSNTIILCVVSDVFMAAAGQAADADQDIADWKTAKSCATMLYDAARSLITLYDSAETGLRVYYVTALDSDGDLYYAIGDENASECTVLYDIITYDTEITPYEEEETV